MQRALHDMSPVMEAQRRSSESIFINFRQMMADQRAWTETTVRDMVARPASLQGEDLMRIATITQAMLQGRVPGGTLESLKEDASGE
eukprot:7195786-Pyramimonas_sp.AAC.1